MRRETKKNVKKIEDDSFCKIMTSLLFSQFTANLEQSENRIPDSLVCKTYIFINSSLLSYKKRKTELKNL